ncbi:MAG: stage IV sporulation protein A [Clostridia bacterium]|nr:stage IV sporulation protein A [Clostridia bacterium]
MADQSIYKDIATRTGGEIYVGVVGPVRTGKSTLIKKFMEQLVIPNIRGEYDRLRAKDELPQSAGGKTVMTTEPKFIPDEAVQISIDDATGIKVKLVDCVGYVVPEALGQLEEGKPRMVNTPWQKEPMPFEQAAEFGTRKVITDHATIGLLVTCDGSVCDLQRGQYIEAEERVARELTALGKPFAIVLNSAHPNAEETVALALSLEEKYGAPVALVNCLELNAEDIRHILGLILQEFPIKEVEICLPSWTAALEREHWLTQSLKESILSCAGEVERMGQVKDAFAKMEENENVSGIALTFADMGCGRARVKTALREDLYYKVLSELTGFALTSDEELIALVRRLAEQSRKYEKVEKALESVEKTGYGIVMPESADLRLEEPEIVRQPGGYGLRLRASAPSIHMIKADVETEVNPIVGSEQQSEEMAESLKKRFEKDPEGIWQTNMLGKTLFELTSEGLEAKLAHMPEESQKKLSETLSRIINEGSNGLLCILV